MSEEKTDIEHEHIKNIIKSGQFYFSKGDNGRTILINIIQSDDHITVESYCIEKIDSVKSKKT